MTTKRRREFWILATGKHNHHDVDISNDAEERWLETIVQQVDPMPNTVPRLQKWVHAKEVLPGDKDLQAEIERLRAEVETLKEKLFVIGTLGGSDESE